MNFVITFIAEFRNQRKNYFGRFSSLITLFFWPLLSFLTYYYTYFSFDISNLSAYGIHNRQELLLFIVSGVMVYNCFWTMVQGAGQLQYDRKNGMLEQIILSPCSKLGFVYGRVFGGIIHNAWMFTVLCVIIYAKNAAFSVELLFGMLLIFLLLVVSGTIFGGFITSLFLISRDTNIIFTICDQPMNFLSGTTLPLACLPFYLRAWSYVLPTTYIIDLFRKISLSGYQSMTFPFGLALINLVLILLTIGILKRILEKNREDGSYALY